MISRAKIRIFSDFSNKICRDKFQNSKNNKKDDAIDLLILSTNQKYGVWIDRERKENVLALWSVGERREAERAREREKTTQDRCVCFAGVRLCLDISMCMLTLLH